MSTTSGQYTINFKNDEATYCLTSRAKNENEIGDKNDLVLEWKPCTSGNVNQIFDITMGNPGSVKQTMNTRVYTMASHNGPTTISSYGVHMNSSASDKKWDIGPPCSGSTYNYIKSLGTSHTSGSPNPGKCLTKSQVEASLMISNCDCTSNNVPKITFEKVSNSPSGESCDCVTAVEDNLPFLAKKGGPLAWGWWIIIGMGVLCMCAVIGTYFLVAK